jgi:hypothetical protein
MSYILIIIGFITFALACFQHKLMAFFSPLTIGASTAVKVEQQNEPPVEGDPPSRDLGYYFHGTTVVLRVCFPYCLSSS